MGAPIQVSEDVLETSAKGRPKDAQNLAEAEIEGAAAIASSVTTKWAPAKTKRSEER